MEDNLKFKTRASVDYRNTQRPDLVFFRVDVKEMFGIDLNYPGIKTCLNKAFMACKQYIPYCTGITYRSFTQKQLNDHVIENFFDPKKVIGQNRKGHIVDQYYVAFISLSTKNYSWETKVMYQYYETLFSEVSKLKKAKEQIRKGEAMALNGQVINKKQGAIFLSSLREQFKQKREEAQRIKELNDDKRRTLLHKEAKK